MTRRLPIDLTGSPVGYMTLSADQVDAVNATAELVQADHYFEHLRNPANQLWYFVAQCWLDRQTNHVPAFVAQHKKELMKLTCYLPIDYLKVVTEIEIPGLLLLPVNDPTVPGASGFLSLGPPVGCVAAVDVEGTNFERMAHRARQAATHALRVLRIALRDNPGISYEQLRFRLGTSYAFDRHASGQISQQGIAYELSIAEDQAASVREHVIATLPVHPSTDIEKQVHIAMRWMERAWFADEPLVSMLYLFFSLEATIGDKSARLKAHQLAFRQAMLSHLATGGFSHPNDTWFLYDKVRSGAVHGDDLFDVSWDSARKFAWNVRQTLNNFVTIAERQGFAKRGRLLRFLDRHQDREGLIAWLRVNGGHQWVEYLDRIENEFD